MEDVPIPVVTHSNNVLYSMFSNAEVYINNQQIYSSNGLYPHKSHNSNNLKGAISDYKEILHSERYNFEELFDEIKETRLF